MENKLAKIALTMVFGLSLSFAQETPEKLAVYVSGSGEAVNKSLGSKLLVAMSQSGEYVGIVNPDSFQDELASGKGDISVAANRHGADYVCVVNMTGVFGAYSITARLIKIAGSQVVKIGSADRAIKSMEDLTAVSNELARQLLPSGSQPLSPPATSPAPAAEQKQCERTYNINELLFKIKDGFPSKLKDCSSKLAKDMLNPFGKKLEPKSFMMQCSVDGVKKELPDGFPNTDKIIGSLTNFVQGLLNSASAGGALDPKKLVSAVGSMNIEELLSDVKNLSAIACVVDELYEPPVSPAESAEDNDSGKKKDKSWVSFGIRAGPNLSYAYTSREYNDKYDNYGKIVGMQLGFVVDFAPISWLHIQPGLMYVSKGMDFYPTGKEVDSYYLEFPLLLSLKLAAFRLNAGPYFDLCILGQCFNDIDEHDIGLNTGIGFDIGIFYIGVFYDYGLTDVSNMSGYSVYNRTLGFNLGVNL